MHKKIDVVTLEFENVSTAALERLEQRVPVRPGPGVLEVAQNRLKEKRSMNRCGLPTAPFAGIESLEDLERFLTEFGGKGVLKTCQLGL